MLKIIETIKILKKMIKILIKWPKLSKNYHKNITKFLERLKLLKIEHSHSEGKSQLRPHPVYAITIGSNEAHAIPSHRNVIYQINPCKLDLVVYLHSTGSIN